MDGSNGGSTGGGGYRRLAQESQLKKPTLHLPMTAIDSFLGHSRHHFYNQSEINPSTAGTKKEKKLTVPSFDCGFGYSSYHNLPIGGGETCLGFTNGLDFDGVAESLKSTEYVRNTDETSGGVSTSHLANPKRKKNQPNGLVKGQWTLEEDRVLVELVMQHGERNWSQIAKQLPGRVGKQCRERWNNHLRPNVKKDRWSEEEEMLLVEAHEKLGNKWSEIAKSIPGRTENTIKNHWNAARRRQNTRRKNKPSHQTAGVSTVLDDYIKAKNLHTPALNPKASPTQITAPSTTSTVTQDTPIDTDITNSLSQFVSYEDEVMFMQSFIASLSYPALQPFQQLPPPPLQQMYNRPDDMSSSYYQVGQATDHDGSARSLLSSSEGNLSGSILDVGYRGSGGYEGMKEHRRVIFE